MTGISRLSDRVTDVSKGSKKDTDMSISIPETMTLYVREQEEVSKTTTVEVKKSCKFKWPQLNYTHNFLTKKGIWIHDGTCKWKDEYELEKW